jgi:uncharacterized protein (TIRG00374 family)
MKRWHLWLGIFISLFFLGWVLKDLLPVMDEFWVAVTNANYWWIFPGVAVYLLAVWVRAWRWHYLLRPVKSVPTREMFPIVAIGYLANNILPARAGELVRAALLKNRQGVSISASLATVIVERVFDGVVMLSFIFINLPELMRLTGGSGVTGEVSIRDIAIWGSVFFFGALLVFLLAAMFPMQTELLLEWLAERFIPKRYRDKLLGFAKRFLDGLKSLRSPVDVLMVFLTSVVIWLLETGKYWFVMHGFPFQVSFFALMLMNGVVNLATTIPSAPGYVGTFDKPGIEVLKAYGVSTAVASGYTLVLHISLWASANLLGIYFLWKEGIRWKDSMAGITNED